MSTTYGLWDEPIPTPPPAPPKQTRRDNRYSLAGGPTTDIKAWLLQNAPSDYEELMELRKALYRRHTHGRYTIARRGQTQLGEEKFTVTGRESALLIVSDKARHFLLRWLCRLLKRMD